MGTWVFFVCFTPRNFYLEKTNSVFWIYYYYCIFFFFTRDHGLILRRIRNIGLIPVGRVCVSEVHGNARSLNVTGTGHPKMIHSHNYQAVAPFYVQTNCGT